MKKTMWIVFFFASFFIFSTVVTAEEASKEIMNELEKEFNSFKESLPDYAIEFFPSSIWEKDFSSITNGNIDENDFLEQISAYLLSGIDSVLKTFASILVLIIVLSVFATLKDSFSNDGVNHAFSLCSTLSLAIVLFKVCTTLTNNAILYIKMLCNVMTAFLPIMTGVLTLSGSVSQAVVANGSMLLFINLIENFLVTYMSPLIKITLAFSCVRAFNPSCDLSGVTKVIKTTFTSVTVFTMSVFMFVLSYKNVLSQSVDNLSIKTARFAISSFVPLVGSTINDALRTVTSSLSLIKNSVGAIALISITIIMLPIIINLFLNKISFSILSSVSSTVGGKNESTMLEDADSVCSFLLTLVCCTCVLFIFALTLFLKSTVGVAL